MGFILLGRSSLLTFLLTFKSLLCRWGRGREGPGGAGQTGLQHSSAMVTFDPTASLELMNVNVLKPAGLNVSA